MERIVWLQRRNTVETHLAETMSNREYRKALAEQITKELLGECPPEPPPSAIFRVYDGQGNGKNLVVRALNPEWSDLVYVSLGLDHPSLFFDPATADLVRDELGLCAEWVRTRDGGVPF